MTDSPAYGRSFWPVTLQNLKDRFSEQRLRARARMGFLRQPPGKGSKIVWIKAGASRRAVRLGVELLGAIREKRLDVKLVLTFEEDYADILEHRVSGMQNIGLAYGPCDRRSAVKRILQRFQPFAIITVQDTSHEHLFELAEKAGVQHVLAVNAAAHVTETVIEAAYPQTVAQAESWQAAAKAKQVAPAVDPFSLFVESQADATLKTILQGGQERAVWWAHCSLPTARALAAKWPQSALASDQLVVSIADDASNVPEEWIKVSNWNRQALGQGEVLLLDDARWLAAASSAAQGLYLQAASGEVLWQALAGGTACAHDAKLAAEFPGLADISSQQDDVNALLAYWVHLQETPFEARRAGDAARRWFWDERREMQQVLDELLQRVFDW